MAKQLMLEAADVRARALAAFNRNWRSWMRSQFVGEEGPITLSVNLRPPRESDLVTSGQIARARDWATRWKSCAMPGVVWERRSWSRVGDQSIPVRVSLVGAGQIALWAQRDQTWDTALHRADDLLERLAGSWRATCVGQKFGAEGAAEGMRQVVAETLRLSIGDWSALSDDDWNTALLVWDWLLEHPQETSYVRQLPIRGIDTKWVEGHEKSLRPLCTVLIDPSFAFARPERQFRCKACSSELLLAGCDEFAFSATQLARWEKRPRTVVICENLVNVLCLHDLPGVLAVHGSGFAVTELKAVPWLASVPIVYWGDLDSNGFAILNALRAFAPHACSLMMDDTTLHRYFDLCVNEPTPITGAFERLTPAEHETLCALAQGDPSRNIANLRLEQERIEWAWAYERLSKGLDAR